jgi:hypothetical protein
MLQFFLFCTLRTQLSLSDKSFLLSSDLAKFSFTLPEPFKPEKHQAILHRETTCSCFTRNGFVINVSCFKLFLKSLKGICPLDQHKYTLKSDILCDFKEYSATWRKIGLKEISIFIGTSWSNCLISLLHGQQSNPAIFWYNKSI